MKSRLSAFLVSLMLGASLTFAIPVESFGQTDTLKDVKPFVSDIRELLVGQTPGTVAMSSFGSPGMKPSVYIRGLHLFNEDPVFYVDGVKVLDLGLIAPESIEKIEVLSGAEAMMRFGPEAGCGALAITTRKAARTGFHASYALTGAIHQLAWEPKQITLEEWNKYLPYYTDRSQNPYLLDRFKTSFAQNHHLNLQYLGNRIKVASSFDFLDNDGPQDGRKDSQRRFYGNARIEYLPLDWLRIELSGGAGRSTSSNLRLMTTFLYNLPLENTQIAQDVLANSDNKPYHEGLSAQALVEFLPVSGLSIRAFYGLSSEKIDSYQVNWLKEQDYFSVNNGSFETWYWNQYGIDADYLKSFGAHTISVGLTAKRQYYDHFNVYSFNGAHRPSEYDIPWGDYEAVKSLYIDPILEGMRNLNALPGASYSSAGGKDNLTDFAFKANYDWNKHLYAGFGIYKRLKEALSYSSDLRWDSGNGWAVFGSWGKTNTIYHNSRINTVHIPLPAEFSRMDVGAEAFFNIGIGTLALRALGFLDSDLYYGGNQYRIESTGLKIRNEGIETSAEWSGQTGSVTFNAGASLTLYKNKVLAMNENIGSFGYDNNLIVKENYPVKVAWLRTLENIDRETGTPTVGTPEAYGNGVFPTAVLGLHGSIAWNNFQLSVRGHGNFGQSVVHSHHFDLLTRHYLINSWRPENKDAKYPLYSYYPTVCNSSAALQDASFFRIDQIRLDYTLPVSRFSSYINLFLSLENFFLFTSYPGSDPEYLLDWNTIGEETGSFPSTKRVVTGLKISF